MHGLGADDDPLVQFIGSSVAISDTYFLNTDMRGSVVLVTKRLGTPTNLNTYDEYGVPGVGNTGRFGFTGQTWVPELGLWYYKARMYSPTLGRFMQTDPIGYGDGMNMYAYVGGDPVNFVDPTGMAGCVTSTTTFTETLCSFDRNYTYPPMPCGWIHLSCDFAPPADYPPAVGEEQSSGGGGDEEPQNEDVCAILANTPGDNLFIHGGGRVGLGFVPGAENVVTIEDNGRVSVTSTADFGAGIAGQASALAVGMNGDVRPDGTTSAGSHFDWDIQLGVSIKDVFSSGVRAAFSKGGGGLKFGATLRDVLETQTTTRTIHDFNCD